MGGCWRPVLPVDWSDDRRSRMVARVKEQRDGVVLVPRYCQAVVVSPHSCNMVPSSVSGDVLPYASVTITKKRSRWSCRRGGTGRSGEEAGEM